MSERARCDQTGAGVGGEGARVHLVSRHPGAMEWMRARLAGRSVIEHSHLTYLTVQPGDIVCGVLPLNWAAGIGAAGARACVIDVDIPPQLRGVELSAMQLDDLGARLVEYRVERIETPFE